MASFDVVSELDLHEVNNAVDQANREVGNRYDFKGTDANFKVNEAVVTLICQDEYPLKPMMEILRTKLSARKVDLKCLLVKDPELSGKESRQTVELRHGLEGNLAKEIVKTIKGAKLKVQAAIQEGKVRVTGKKRDDLQKVMALIREQNFDLPLQFINYRD